MLCSINLGRLKSTMKLCNFYYGNICPLALDFKPVLFRGFNFLIEKVYGTHGISRLILDNIMFVLVFLSWNWFSFNAAYIFIPETLKCLVFFVFVYDWYLFFSKLLTFLLMIPAMLWFQSFVFRIGKT